MLLAGYETTSTALSYTTHLLAEHPDVQERLHDEIIDVFGDNGVLPLLANLLRQWTTNE